MKFVGKLNLPIRVNPTKSNTKKGWASLSLNQYANWQGFRRNSIKEEFKKRVKADVLTLPKQKDGLIYKLEYTLYYGQNRSLDISNFGAVVDKFFADALTELKFWKDDNINVLKRVEYIWGGVDRENPRMEVKIFTI